MMIRVIGLLLSKSCTLTLKLWYVRGAVLYVTILLIGRQYIGTSGVHQDLDKPLFVMHLCHVHDVRAI